MADFRGQQDLAFGHKGHGCDEEEDNGLCGWRSKKRISILDNLERLRDQRELTKEGFIVD